jgi:ribosomal subunit interface protein
MQVPLEISYRDVHKTESIEALIREKAAKLERIDDHINSCRIAVERPQKFQSHGNPYRVRITLRVPPGHELAVHREPSKGDLHSDLESEVRAAFDAAERQLKELKEKRRSDVKQHPDQQMQATIERLFPEQEYGFLRTLDGRQVFFHRNSVLHNEYDRLEIGTGVRYSEEMGVDGPQASTVEIIDKPSL